MEYFLLNIFTNKFINLFFILLFILLNFLFFYFFRLFLNLLCNNEFFQSIYKTLDTKLFGLTEVKDSIISWICQRINNPSISNSNSKYLCLCGPAGVGKTSIVHAISEAIRIPYSYLCL